MDEVNNPAAKGQENSPLKIIIQHSHTNDSEPEDDSPDTNEDMDDPDNKEEHDHFMFNFDDELPEDEDEDQTDACDEERNVPEDQPIPEQTKTNSKVDATKNVPKPPTNFVVAISPTELEALKRSNPLEYLKVIISSKGSSSKKSPSTSSMSGGPITSHYGSEVL
ncbi:histone deacetylase HDT1-like [Lathyrus oleraceus]|uniref:histone deacetylase HDT1-like n=1 Tax=Pisum sativum TaxID=3888 RepID=UPI0021CFEAD4|nr:histone deacetylase HDT1-like [Pisum sativum]